MISLFLGFVLGGLVVGSVVWLSMRHQTTELRKEHNLLVSRVRSFLALLDAGLLEARHPEVRKMLAETQSMVEERQVADRPPSGARPPEPERQRGDDEPDIPSILSRPHRVVEPGGRTTESEPDRPDDE